MKEVSDLNLEGFDVSGEKPVDGWVQLEKGMVTSYSLKFGDYIVSYNSVSKETSTIKNGGLLESPIPKIESCPNCVFAFYYSTDKKYISGKNGGESETLSSDEYTKDYTKLTDSSGNSVNYFLGHVLGSNNQILESYACGIEKYDDDTSKAFCLKAFDYDANVDVLNDVFSCNASKQAQNAMCNDSTYSMVAHAFKGGDVHTYGGQYSSCDVFANGDSYCR